MHGIFFRILFLIHLVGLGQMSWAQSVIDWPAEMNSEITALECSANFKNSKFIDVKYDANSLETFKLFYFTTLPFDENKKNLLYIEGGPGGVAGAYLNKLRFVDSSEYNVIYFHARGAGCSAFPRSNVYDKFLNTSLVLQDLEVIRTDLKIDKWDVVFGLSYGSYVGLRYSTEHPDKMKSLVLEGYFDPKTNNQVSSQDRIIRVANTLADVFDWPEFSHLTTQDLQNVLDECISVFTGKSKKDEQYQQEVFSRCSSSAVYGSNIIDPYIRSLAAWVIEFTLIKPYSKISNYVLRLPKPKFQNTLAYASERVNVAVTFQDGLNDQILEIVNSLPGGFPNLHNYVSPDQPQYYLSPYIVFQNSIFDNAKYLNSKVNTTVFEGASDLSTNPDSTRELIKSAAQVNYTNYSAVILPKGGHSRLFLDECYLKAFSALDDKQKLKDILTNELECKTDTTLPLELLNF